MKDKMTLGLHIRLILDTERAHRIKNTKTINEINYKNYNNKKKMGKRKNLISRVIMLLDSNVQY